MRIVDFHTFPDGSTQRAELIDAVAGLDLGEGKTTTPIADDAPVAIGFPDDWTDDEVEEHAHEIQEELAVALGENVSVRFALDDAEAEEGESELTD
jgi:hypothetical protein